MRVPLRVAERMAGVARLAVVPLPPPGLEAFAHRLVWHGRSHQDPASRWLRALIVETCRPPRPSDPTGRQTC